MNNLIGRQEQIMSNKIYKVIGVIIKARPLGKKALLSLYNSMIYPLLTYCCKTWGATYLYNIDMLQYYTCLQYKTTVFISPAILPYELT